MKPLSKAGSVAARTVATETLDPRPDWFWAELAHLRDRWDVLRHPFYVRWSSGELSHRELASYVEEYDHLVVAIADLSWQAAHKADRPLALLLEDQAAAETDQIELWREFARATGWTPEASWAYGADPHRATAECANSWAGSPDRPLAHDLVTLYAVEGSQAEIAAAKLDGLVHYYGFDEGSATEYFRTHVRVDRAHAALARAALEDVLIAADPFSLLTQAETAHRTYWHMLDAIEEDQGR